MTQRGARDRERPYPSGRSNGPRGDRGGRDGGAAGADREPSRAAGRGSGTGRPRKPELGDERPRLPRDVYRDLKGAAKDGSLDDVARAYGQAGVALDEGRPADAERLLRWAKSVASRSGAIREALGVAYYLQDKFDEARSELQTYRRLTGRADQNHLLADCVRAQDRPDKVEEYIAEMLAADVDIQRTAEGVMVLAGARADRGDIDGALSALTKVSAEAVPVQPTRMRMWYLEAGLRGQRGERARERELLEKVEEVEPDYLDTAERLRSPVGDPPGAD